VLLITGATGQVGGAVLRCLVARGIPVRALVRDPQRAQKLVHQGVETVIADLERPETLDAALAGVEGALLVSPLHPRQVEWQGHFIEAARRAGRVHIVKISGLGTALDSPVRSGRWHAQIERQLEASGLPFTHLRPLFFMQNLLRFAPTIAAHGTFVGALNRGKVAMIDVRDVAAVAAVALTTTGHAGRAYTLTGPEALSYEDVARRLSAIVGKPIAYEDVPLAEWRQRLRAAGMPEWQVEVQLDFAQALSAGLAAVVTETVEMVTGRPPRRFEQFAREHAQLFRGA
jgi:uncharacterized protein YbjT (DUF2867 family)